MKVLVWTLENHVCKSPISVPFYILSPPPPGVIDMSLPVGLTRVIEFPRFTSIGRWLCAFRIYAYTCGDSASQWRSSPDDDSPTHVIRNRCGSVSMKSYFVTTTGYNTTTITFLVVNYYYNRVHWSFAPNNHLIAFYIFPSVWLL